jgi:F-type H+-transporting ATPase subunit a
MAPLMAALLAAPPDLIMPHIMDSHVIDYPCLRTGFMCESELPRWAPIHLGPVAIDLSPTKHVVWLLIAAVLVLIVMLLTARAHGRQTRAGSAPKGFANGMEAMVLYLRDEVVLPNVGPHGERFVPFVLTLFFFILFANLLGLVPYGSTATGNIAVTATLAIAASVMIEVSGMRALGWKYIWTVIYWPHDMKLFVKIPMTIIMTPVEIVGKFTKPFALAIRLFANMTAGHVIVLALIGLIFTFGTYWVVPGPIIMGVGIMLLEIFVAFIQAYVFAILTAAFIGQIRTSAH